VLTSPADTLIQNSLIQKMNDKTKKIFLALTVIVPFLFYCVYYYAGVFKNAPYKFTEFKSFTFEFGSSDSLVNKYNSETGEYQYLNSHDSLVKTNLHLTKNDLLYLHRKAADLGFWNFPEDERSGDTTRINGIKPPRYIIAFNYKRKSKRVVFDENFGGDFRLKDANEHIIKEIEHVLADAEDRQKK